MGGTLIRLVEDGHRVHVAYMTSGNIAVFDHDAQRVAELVTEYNRLFGIDEQRSGEVLEQVRQGLLAKAPGQPDHETILKIKALIRWSEARAGAIHIGCQSEDLHFLDLPFYRTGTIAKRPMSSEDTVIIRELLQRVQQTKSTLQVILPIHMVRTESVRKPFCMLFARCSPKTCKCQTSCSIEVRGKSTRWMKSKSRYR